MTLWSVVLLSVTVAIVSTSAFAQGPGGRGAGTGFSGANTPGWVLMTPEERNEHRAKMLGFTRYDDCVTYLAQHHQLMLDRAKAKGVTLPAMPRQSFCERMKESGRLK